MGERKIPPYLSLPRGNTRGRDKGEERKCAGRERNERILKGRERKGREDGETEMDEKTQEEDDEEEGGETENMKEK